jgi:hypothetical protein
LDPRAAIANRMARCRLLHQTRQTAFMQRAANFTNDAFVLHGDTAVL